MPRPITLTTSDASGGAVQSSIAPLNYLAKTWRVSVITTVTGTATYTLQFTGDRTDNATPSNWQSHPLMTASTVSDTVEFTSPVTAVRINQTAGSGSVSAVVVQSGT